MASAVGTTLPAIAAHVSLQKYTVESLTAGGVER